MSDQQLEAVQDAVRAAVSEAVKGTPWEPSIGAVLTECVVVMGWYDSDGDQDSTLIRCGSPWGTRGLLTDAVEYVDTAAAANLELRFAASYDDDEEPGDD